MKCKKKTHHAASSLQQLRTIITTAIRVSPCRFQLIVDRLLPLKSWVTHRGQRSTVYKTVDWILTLRLTFILHRVRWDLTIYSPNSRCQIQGTEVTRHRVTRTSRRIKPRNTQVTAQIKWLETMRWHMVSQTHLTGITTKVACRKSITMAALDIMKPHQERQLQLHLSHLHRASKLRIYRQTFSKSWNRSCVHKHS